MKSLEQILKALVKYAEAVHIQHDAEMSWCNLCGGKGVDDEGEVNHKDDCLIEQTFGLLLEITCLDLSRILPATWEQKTDQEMSLAMRLIGAPCDPREHSVKTKG